ncbi:hypothetical protein Hanom_Chr12g01100651 [Helianthus anomalus]
MVGIGSSQAFGSTQAFGSPLREPYVVPDTQLVVEEAQQNKTKCNHKKKTETRTNKITCSHGMI